MSRPEISPGISNMVNTLYGERGIYKVIVAPMAGNGQFAVLDMPTSDSRRAGLRFRTSTAAGKEKAASAPVGLSAAKRQNGILQCAHACEPQRCGRGIEPAIL